MSIYGDYPGRKYVPGMPIAALVSLIAGVVPAVGSVQYFSNIIATDLLGEFKFFAYIIALCGLILSLGLLHSSAVLYRGRRSARFVTGVFSLFGLSVFLVKVLVTGTYETSYFVITEVVLLLLLLSMINTPEAKMRFGYRKRLFPFMLIAVWIVMCAIFLYSFIFIKYARVLPSVRDGVFDIKHVQVSNENLPLPFEYSINIPDYYKSVEIYKVDGGTEIIFSSSYNGHMSVSNFSNLDQFVPFGALMGYFDNQSFVDKFFNEKFGLFFVMAKNLILTREDVAYYQKIQNSNIFGIVEQRQNKKSVLVYLFDKKFRNIGEITIISDTKEDNDLYLELMSTLAFQGDIMPSEQYIKSSVDNFGRERYFKALRASVFAAATNWKNPDTHVLLAKIYQKLGRNIPMQDHINHALKIAPKHKEAIILSESIKKN
jgi:uncharacterized integral membrane protein